MAKRRALLLPVTVLIALVATQGPGKLGQGDAARRGYRGTGLERGRRDGSAPDQPGHLRDELLRCRSHLRAGDTGAGAALGRRRQQPLQLAGRLKQCRWQLVFHGRQRAGQPSGGEVCRRLREHQPRCREQEPAHDAGDRLGESDQHLELLLPGELLSRSTVVQPVRASSAHQPRGHPGCQRAGHAGDGQLRQRDTQHPHADPRLPGTHLVPNAVAAADRPLSADEQRAGSAGAYPDRHPGGT